VTTNVYKNLSRLTAPIGAILNVLIIVLAPSGMLFIRETLMVVGNGQALPITSWPLNGYHTSPGPAAQL